MAISLSLITISDVNSIVFTHRSVTLCSFCPTWLLLQFIVRKTCSSFIIRCDKLIATGGCWLWLQVVWGNRLHSISSL